MKATQRNVSETLRAEGLPVELVKGAGYCYFVYDETATGGTYETESVMVYRLDAYTHAEWCELGREFARKVRGE